MNPLILAACAALVLTGCASRQAIRPPEAATGTPATVAEAAADTQSGAEPMDEGPAPLAEFLEMAPAGAGNDSHARVGQAAPLPVQGKTAPAVWRSGRYTERLAVPEPAQVDLLSVVVQVTFPPQVITVGEAVRWLLLRSGYRLQVSREESGLLELPLPEVHRRLGPVPLRAGLQLLAGPGYRLCEDPVRRTVWYELEAS